MNRHLIILSLALVFCRCSSSHITSAWQAAAVPEKVYNKIMVIGLIGDPDRSIRERMEEHLEGDLKDLGYNAVTAIQEYGPKAFENVSEDEALKQLGDKSIDAVITVVLLDKTKESFYVRGNPRYFNFSDHSNNFWRYYNSMYGRVYTPGYYGVSTKYFWESNFYDMETGKLMYSARSHSFDPASSGQLGHEYGLMIVKDMVKRKILHPVTEPVKKAF